MLHISFKWNKKKTMETKMSSKSLNHKVLRKYEQNSKEQNSSGLSKHALQCEKIQSKI